jgi:hypothetical protein
MKKAGRICLLIAAILYLILGLAFLVIEGRNFFSFEWQLYAHSSFGGFVSFARMLSALLYLAAGVLAILVFSPKKEHPVLMIYIDVFAIATFVIGIAVASYLKEMAGPTPLYLSLPISLTSDLYTAGAVLIYADSTHYKKADSAPKEDPNKL